MTLFGLSVAQEVKTYSVYDANQNGEITITDVSETVEQVMNSVAATSTQQYVTADDLNAVLSNLTKKIELINNKLDYIMKKEELGNPFVYPDENGIITNGHDYVDLGITYSNGRTIYWATCNVGATTPEENGDVFMWGETEPKAEGDNSYKYFQDGEPTKYCTRGGYEYLDREDDAAFVNWGGSWRMPGTGDLEALMNRCYWQWVNSYNGKNVSGYVVYKAKADSDKGKYSFDNPTLSSSYSVSSDAHIFLPAVGTGGACYWSDELFRLPTLAYLFCFSPSSIELGGDSRTWPAFVRPVCM